MSQAIFHDVVQFHQKFDLLPENPGKNCLSYNMTDFRYEFMKEELEEWADANATNHLPDALDAMIDLIYVAVGTMHLHGFTYQDMEKAWDRVHAANMKKVRATDATQSKRDSAYDVVKPRGWVAPVLDDLCQN